MNNNSTIDDFGGAPELIENSIRGHPTAPATCKADRGEDEKDALYNSVKLVQWAICGPNTYKPVSLTYPVLSSGIYKITATQQSGIVFEKKSVCVDDLLLFPDSVSDQILREITTFWTKGLKFKEHGFLHRRGYLLYGPAGSGKTCIVQQIIHDIVKQDGLVFQCSTHPQIFNEGLSIFRSVEPHRPVVCLFEDIDAIVQEYSEDDILTLLDGENQIDKVLNIATTNYPEKLDKRLVARPRRFDRVMKVDMPPPCVRKMYFNIKLKVSESELDMWVAETDGFSFAACAELVISVCCFDKPFAEAVKILREMMKVRISSSDYDGVAKVGFN